MNERVKWQRVTDSSGACVTRRRPAVHGTGRRAPQPRRAGISTSSIRARARMPVGRATCASAARGGHLECLRYAHENGCPWDGATCASAARGGHLECLRYAHENGCPWGGATTACMQPREGIWSACDMRENGCPWDLRVHLQRQQRGGGHLECLVENMHGMSSRGLSDARYAENGCAVGRGAPARQQLGEGIWSACDMHMRMDARGTGHLCVSSWKLEHISAHENGCPRVHLRVSSRGRASGVPAICA